MRRLRPWAALALALSASTGTAAEPALSPEGLGKLIECRGTTQDLGAYGDVLLADSPKWLKRVDDNGHAGMLGLWSFRLGHPVTIFGRSVETVSFLNQWVVIELPRAEALAVIREQGLLRAPIKITEQYYHFADPEKGPMLGAFAPTDDAFGLLLGAKPPADEDNKTLFIGCNYAPMDQKEFLKAAAIANSMFDHDK